MTFNDTDYDEEDDASSYLDSVILMITNIIILISIDCREYNDIQNITIQLKADDQLNDGRKDIQER